MTVMVVVVVLVLIIVTLVWSSLSSLPGAKRNWWWPNTETRLGFSVFLLLTHPTEDPSIVRSNHLHSKDTPKHAHAANLEYG